MRDLAGGGGHHVAGHRAVCRRGRPAVTRNAAEQYRRCPGERPHWKNTTVDEVTVLDRTVTGYPQGRLLVAATAIGFVIALPLVASVSSTSSR
jgi:hypothetical protein